MGPDEWKTSLKSPEVIESSRTCAINEPILGGFVYPNTSQRFAQDSGKLGVAGIWTNFQPPHPMNFPGLVILRTNSFVGQFCWGLKNHSFSRVSITSQDLPKGWPLRDTKSYPWPRIAPFACWNITIFGRYLSRWCFCLLTNHGFLIFTKVSHTTLNGPNTMVVYVVFVKCVNIPFLSGSGTWECENRIKSWPNNHYQHFAG